MILVPRLLSKNNIPYPEIPSGDTGGRKKKEFGVVLLA